MAPITINGNTLNPQTQAAAIRAFGLEAEDASKSDYILVQTSAFLSPEQKLEFERLNIVIHEYVSENTYLCGYKETDLNVIRSLPYVTWANVYLQHFVVSPALRPTRTAAVSEIVPSVKTAPLSRTPHLVDIVLHEGVDPDSADVKSAIARTAHVDGEELQIHGDKIRLMVEEQDLDDLAAIDAVRLIQKVYPLKLHNNVARKIINADVSLNGTSYHGSGQVVAVADTGLDETHHAFAGRVRRLYSLGGRRGKTDDPDGHGTHVCGSVLGSGTSASMGGTIEGIAPEATLVVQSLLDPRGGLGGIPINLSLLFEEPYRKDSARIHNNSWGSTVPALPYNQDSTEIDRFVWENQDMVILFAAGNDGVDLERGGDGIIELGQIGSHSAAKNCITVGASENHRPEIQATYGDFNRWGLRYPQAPIIDDKVASNPDGMAAFSSRGPTREGRFKPDVVAPGTGILSTHSIDSQHRPEYGISSDEKWSFLAGTSQAAPQVAGAAAVIREALIKNGTPRPSAALIKALLINGAVDLLGQYNPSEVGPSPNNISGFGRIDVANSVIEPGTDHAGFGEGGPIEQGSEDTISVKVPRHARELQTHGEDSVPPVVGTTATGSDVAFKITLVWTDYPGAMLQNDLDLIVKTDNGRERHGNVGARPGFDKINNVEQVRLATLPAGDLEVIIRATRITRGPQRYAYAWRFG